MEPSCRQRGELLAEPKIAREHRLQGILAKWLDSPYRPGRRSLAWMTTPCATEPRSSSAAGHAEQDPASPGRPDDCIGLLARRVELRIGSTRDKPDMASSLC